VTAAIIFDFDGVIADSESITNRMLAEALTAIGVPTSFDQALDLYCGWRWSDCQINIEARLGRALPPGFRSDLDRRTEAEMAATLQPVEGVGAFLEATRHLPRAIASSSPLPYLDAVIDQLGFAQHFNDRLCSAARLPFGKPHPQIYLNAAELLGIKPEHCLAIEDSPTGARAAVAAGMQVVGLCAASHIRAGHQELLKDAGAHHIVTCFEEIGF
jgi:HAD superfamily hydrolase (TIGR01509 family)